MTTQTAYIIKQLKESIMKIYIVTEDYQQFDGLVVSEIDKVFQAEEAAYIYADQKPLDHCVYSVAEWDVL